jgi:DNA-binding protein H-NS
MRKSPKVVAATGDSLTSSDLVKQSEVLLQQAEALKAKERPQVIANIKAAIAHYGLTASDLGLTGGGTAASPAKRGRGKKAAGKAAGKSAGKPAGKKKIAAKQYRDAAGNTWSGFGPRPQWLKDALAAGATEESLRV